MLKDDEGKTAVRRYDLQKFHERIEPACRGANGYYARRRFSFAAALGPLRCNTRRRRF